jgi:hypothetical protein
MSRGHKMVQGHGPGLAQNGSLSLTGRCVMSASPRASPRRIPARAVAPFPSGSHKSIADLAQSDRVVLVGTLPLSHRQAVSAQDRNDTRCAK